MSSDDGAWHGAHPRELGTEELAPMVLAWGRNRPVRCSRCGQRAVDGTVVRGHADRITLRLECRECRGWGTSTIPTP